MFVHQYFLFRADPTDLGRFWASCVDVEKTHKKIYEADFIEILKRDYEGLNWKEIAKKTNELMKPGSFVIFKTDIDVDSLIKWKIAFKRSMEMIIWKELKWKITL